MENLWEIKIDKMDINSPKIILEEQSDYLREMTNGLLYFEIAEYNPPIYEELTTQMLQKMRNQQTTRRIAKPGDELPNSRKIANFQVNLRSTKIKYFAFHILTYQHNIEIYPVHIDVNPDIDLISVEIRYDLDEKEFKEIVKKILNSKKMQNIVNSLFSLSSEKEKEIPF